MMILVLGVTTTPGLVWSNTTPCVDGRILVAFLYVDSRRNYLRHFIVASWTQF